jgi:hypothetical protein
MRKIFGVINVEHLHGLGFAVFQNDEGYPGHAVIRPMADMAIDVFGVKSLQIPSFVMEVMSHRSTGAVYYIVTEKNNVVYSEPFTGIKKNWSWGQGNERAQAAESEDERVQAVESGDARVQAADSGDVEFNIE